MGNGWSHHMGTVQEGTKRRGQGFGMIYFFGFVLVALAAAYTSTFWAVCLALLLIFFSTSRNHERSERRRSDSPDYTPELTELIANKYQEGQSLREIAGLSGKSVASIRAKLVHLRLYNKYGNVGGAKQQTGLPPIPFIVGEENYTKLVSYLQESTYNRVSSVICEGNYAIRGGIIDVWLYGDKQPLRLDYFGERLESAEQFDPASGSSAKRHNDISIGFAPSLNG